MSKLVDYDGLLYFWQKLKEKFVAKESGKGLSTNDYTTAEKNKLSGIAAGANAYTHPSHTAKESGLYKVTVDNKGHVSAATAVTKADITALGIPSTNTTYSAATTSAAGLMSAADKTKLDGLDVKSISPKTHLAVNVETGMNGSDGTSTPTTTYTEVGLTYDKADGNTPTIKIFKIPVGSRLSLSGNSVLDFTEYDAATSSASGLMSSTDKAKLDAFSAASNYALKTDITGLYKFKGTKATYADLPSTGNTQGDVWDVGEGMNYVWTGSKWDALGEVFTVTAVTNSEIDTIVAS